MGDWRNCGPISLHGHEKLNNESQGSSHKTGIKKAHGSTKDRSHQINLPPFLIGEKQYLISVGIRKASH